MAGGEVTVLTVLAVLFTLTSAATPISELVTLNVTLAPNNDTEQLFVGAIIAIAILLIIAVGIIVTFVLVFLGTPLLPSNELDNPSSFQAFESRSTRTTLAVKFRTKLLKSSATWHQKSGEKWVQISENVTDASGNRKYSVSVDGTGATLTIDSLCVDDSGYYRCDISNSVFPCSCGFLTKSRRVKLIVSAGNAYNNSQAAEGSSSSDKLLA